MPSSPLPCIAFIITKSEVGGAQRWVLDQIKLLEQHVKCILITGERGWLSESIPKAQVFIEPALLRRPPTPGGLWRLSRILKENNVSSLVASSANAGIYARLVRIILPRLYVVYVSHGWSSIYNGGKLEAVYTSLERLLARMTHKILCISESDLERAINRIRIAPEKCALITNAVFPEQKEISQALPRAPWKILFVGRLASPKRPDLLIEAVKLLSSVEVELTIVGDGPQNSLIDTENNQRIKWLGEIKGFCDFSNYHIFCLISDSEGLPMSALEACANGTPVLLSEVGGCPELVTTNGLTTPNNAEEISKRIITIINDYSRFSLEALKQAKKHDIREKTQNYLDLYLNQTSDQ